MLRRQKSMLGTLQLDNRMTQDKIDLFYPEVQNQSTHNILLELKMQSCAALYKFVKKRHLQGILA